MTALSLITNGHQPGDLVLPMARILHVPDPGTHLSDIDELPYRLGGRDKKPSKALAYRDRDGNTTLICGLGVTEAAEIQDLAYNSTNVNRSVIMNLKPNAENAPDSPPANRQSTTSARPCKPRLTTFDVIPLPAASATMTPQKRAYSKCPTRLNIMRRQTLRL